jgi:hypothetical protein
MNCLRPPESIDCSFGTLDHRVDVYQAGLLFLGFLAKREIVLDDTSILTGAPREQAELLNSPIGDAIARMLRRHVEHRTPTALDAWRELSSALSLN